MNRRSLFVHEQRLKNPLRLFAVLACWASATVMLGCHSWRDEAATPAFMPSWDEARQALESVLAAWRDAPSPLPSSFDSPAVRFVDQYRRPGQRLLSFQILRQLDVENARQFTVRLVLEREDSPQLVRYNVLGRQPVWVFRLEDYDMISHWEHKMDEPAAPRSRAPEDTLPARRDPPG